MSDIQNFLVTSGVCVIFSQGLAYLAQSSRYSISKIAGLNIMIQWVMYIMQASGILSGNAPTERYYDLTGSVTYIISILISIMLHGPSTLSLRQQILNSFVIVWAIRLGSFLYTRISREDGKDSRFDKIRNNFYSFFNFWTIQGLWVFLTALPVYCLNDSTQSNTNNELNMLDFIGCSIWCFGIVLETIADEQKRVFRKDSRNHSKFINIGVWKLCRHPNYFGEIILWCGIFLSASQGFERYSQYISILSPIMLSLLIINVSGVVLLEKSSDLKWGNEVDYQNYKKTTPVLIPFFGRKGNASW